MDRTELFLCQCNDVSHQLILSTIDDTEPRTVYCSFHLDNYGLWNRIKSAFLYLFGMDRKDGDFDCMLVNPEDAERLSSFLDYLEDEPSHLAIMKLVIQNINMKKRMLVTDGRLHVCSHMIYSVRSTSTVW